MEDPIRHTPAMLSAAKRRELVTRVVRQMLSYTGEREPMLEFVAVKVSQAEKLWRWIPDDKLTWALDRARAQCGGPGLTVEKVAEAWKNRNRKVEVSAEERERRRRAAQERIEREAAPPEVAAAFFHGLAEQLKGD